MQIVGGIEAGGTKFVCAVGRGVDDIEAEISFPTTTPNETIGQAIEFFKTQDKKTPLKAIGIGSFGPIDVNPQSKTYGYITTTPKPGWSHTNFVGMIKKAFDCPIAFDTDVNAAALGEYYWGAAKNLDVFIYLTVGTGVGGGYVVNGQPIHGLMHPEMGHIRLPRDVNRDPFPGNCPYHGDCLEGLVSGPAIEKRWGQKGDTLPLDHAAWPLVAEYLALALVNYTCSIMPRRIILGGGVMQQKHLFSMVRELVQTYLNGYLALAEILERIDEFIVPPALGNKAGMLGSLALANQLLTTNPHLST